MDTLENEQFQCVLGNFENCLLMISSSHAIGAIDFEKKLKFLLKFERKFNIHKYMKQIERVPNIVNVHNNIQI